MANYRRCIGTPTLIFFMQLDADRYVISGFNRGRLLLSDDVGLIGRWVFSASIDSKQKVNDWNKRGGVIPPTSSMPNGEYWQFHTKRIYQPGQPVDDGFLVTFRDSIEYTTVEGGTRSEIMIHLDKPPQGSLGCIVALSKGEWDDFCDAVVKSISHLPTVRLLVGYSY